MSIAYYDRNCEAFFRDTVNADMSEARDAFLAHLKPGARILDAGCGSGRDALAFSRKGFDVTAFDGSKEMVRLAAGYTGLCVFNLSFDEMEWDNEFDGIWACASLLHVERDALPRILSKFVHALRDQGLLYASFKFGALDRETNGRHFTDLDEAGFVKLMQAAGLAMVDHTVRSDVRPGRSDEYWISGLAKRSNAHRG